MGLTAEKMPEALRKKIRQQYPDNDAVLRLAGYGPQGPRNQEGEPRPNRKVRRRAHASWNAFVEDLRADGLTLAGDYLTIWITGLMLYSFNAALSGEKKRLGKEDRNRIKIQTAAKHEAELALQESGAEFRRFARPVNITVLQHGKRRTIDPGNLYHKAVIDCLSAREGGIGVIEDDRAKFVGIVGSGYGNKPVTGVEIVLEVAVQ